MTRFGNILCVAEPGKAARDAISRAATLARNHQARLTVVSVAERIAEGIETVAGGPSSRELQQALVKTHTQQLETLVDPYRKRIEIETRVLVGVPFLQIIRDVMRSGRDLVVKVPEDPQWTDRLFGSDDMHLMRKCPCPVWMVKPQAEKSFRRILAAVDTGDDYPLAELKSRRALNQQILEMAGSLALSEFAELHVVHAWLAIAESLMRGGLAKRPEEEVDQYVEQVRKQHAASVNDLIADSIGNAGQDSTDFLKPQKHLVKGSALQEIPKLALELEADLVVMGTVCRTGIPGFFMGNTAETILSQLHCSVLAIKPSGFVTPVTLIN